MQRKRERERGVRVEMQSKKKKKERRKRAYLLSCSCRSLKQTFLHMQKLRCTVPIVEDLQSMVNKVITVVLALSTPPALNEVLKGWAAKGRMRVAAIGTLRLVQLCYGSAVGINCSHLV